MEAAHDDPKPKSVDKKKRKKSKKKRAEGHPKFPLNGYVRFCNDVRPKVILDNPEMKDPVEITKYVANMWLNLSEIDKAPFLMLAKLDKERFKKELKEFNARNPIEESKPKQKAKLKELALLPSSSSTLITPANNCNSLLKTSIPPVAMNPMVFKKKEVDDVPRTTIGLNQEVPIFTDAFLNHNKAVETELKLLRKSNIEMEQQNSVLEIHVDNMEKGVVKLEDEITATKSKNLQLEVYLTKLRCTLAASLHSLSLPGTKNGATVENIDKYMMELSSAATLQKSPSLVNKARDSIRKMDLNII